MEKGFKTLELLGDLDDKYIYEASRPWKKQHRFFHIQRSWKTAVAGIILLIMVGCTLRYQEDVKAALQRVTSWIGQALGIKNGDTDSYTNVVGKSISRDGITITLNEIVMDSKNLWIAYSDSEDSDADMKDAVEDKLLYTEVCINGQKIQQGLGQRTVNAFSENPITVEDFTIGEEVNTEGNDEQKDRALEHISREGKRLEKLSGKMLQMLGLHQNDSIKMESHSIGELLEHVVQLEAEQAAQRQIQLQTEYEDFSMKMDDELMESLLVNLIDNALRATEAGGRITVKAYKESGRKILEVADNGRGIPQEELGKITEAFYMVDKSRSRQEGGAGLGLALCVKIAEVHGGRLDITSQLGTGTKVRVIFDKKR